MFETVATGLRRTYHKELTAKADNYRVDKWTPKAYLPITDQYCVQSHGGWKH
jgi:hypothetical protein